MYLKMTLPHVILSKSRYAAVKLSIETMEI